MNALIIGGTGIIGSALIREILLRYSTVVVISNKKVCTAGDVRHIISDVNDFDKYNEIAERLNNQYKVWDVVIDLIQFTVVNAKTTFLLFEKYAKHIIILSTALVYDLASKKSGVAVSENHPLSVKGVLGGYVDSKIDIELFWKKSNFFSWTILRPYHIVGAGSNLGCLPFHNRDKSIINKINSGLPLDLIDLNNCKMSFIHPVDIAIQISLISNNYEVFGECYNLSFNKPTTAHEYFNVIGKILNKIPIIKLHSVEELIDSNYGWEMTAMEHYYSGDKLFKTTRILPTKNIEECLNDAIKYINENQGKALNGLEVNFRMNKPPRPDASHIYAKKT